MSVKTNLSFPTQADLVLNTLFGLFVRAMALTVILALGACVSRLPASPDEDRAAQEEFRQDMTQYATLTAKYLEQTHRGTNISQMTLGWFAYDLLCELSSQDDALNQHFSSGGNDLQSYLKTSFRDHPAAEIDQIDALIKQDHATQRLAARYALEVLRHIPNSEDPVETQAAERQELATALETLQGLLQRTATERSSYQVAQAN